MKSSSIPASMALLPVRPDGVMIEGEVEGRVQSGFPREFHVVRIGGHGEGPEGKGGAGGVNGEEMAFGKEVGLGGSILAALEAGVGALVDPRVEKLVRAVEGVRVAAVPSGTRLRVPPELQLSRPPTEPALRR